MSKSKKVLNLRTPASAFDAMVAEVEAVPDDEEQQAVMGMNVLLLAAILGDYAEMRDALAAAGAKVHVSQSVYASAKLEVDGATGEGILSFPAVPLNVSRIR